MNVPMFYVKRRLTDEYVVVKMGETGFYPLDYSISDEEAEQTNLALGNTKAEVEAAETCSMFGCWDNFATIVERYEANG